MSHIILVVDPDESDAAHLARLIAQSLPGSQTLTAPGAEAALDLLRSQRLIPSLVIAEFALEDANGVQLLGKFHEERWLKNVPVAMSSNAASDREIVACYRLGLKAFLGKPVRLLDVRETLRDFARPAQVMESASVVRPGQGHATPAAA